MRERFEGGRGGEDKGKKSALSKVISTMGNQKTATDMMIKMILALSAAPPAKHSNALEEKIN
jgi:hypothetical protein